MIFLEHYVDSNFLQILIIRADMKQDDDLTRIVDTTISTFGQLDILVSLIQRVSLNKSRLVESTFQWNQIEKLMDLII